MFAGVDLLVSCSVIAGALSMAPGLVGRYGPNDRKPTVFLLLRTWRHGKIVMLVGQVPGRRKRMGHDGVGLIESTCDG